MASIAIERDCAALENFSARPRPSLCEIRKFSSISRFEHESQKKGLVNAEASASIQASIWRSLVSPTALLSDTLHYMHSVYIRV